jgi:hypothetical protein
MDLFVRAAATVFSYGESVSNMKDDVLILVP